MAAKSGILPLAAISDVIQTIGELDAEQYNRLLSIVQSQSFRLPAPLLRQLSGSLGLALGDTQNIFAVLGFLYERAEEVSPPNERLDEIETFVARISENVNFPSDTRQISNRLLELLKPSEIHTEKEKLLRLEQGFLPSLTKLSSFVDFRPNFVDADPELGELEPGVSISKFIPVITINMETTAKDTALRSVTLNVPIHEVDDMIKAIERLKKKLSATKDLITGWQI